MTSQRYPGAYHLYFDDNGPMSVDVPDNVLHIAASSWNIDPADPYSRDGVNDGITSWVDQGDTEAHTYNDQFGAFQQYVDLNRRVSGTLNGNYRNRTHEAWNPEGLHGSDAQYNTSRYTGEQCERFSDFLAWDHNENGTLLTNMRDSRPSSHGVGAHRYGVPSGGPYDLVSGGEVWTSHPGKVCPGTARVEQIDGIIARAIVIARAVLAGRCGYLPPGRVNLAAAYARTGAAGAPSTPATPIEKEWDEMASEAEYTRAMEKALAPVLDAINRRGASPLVIGGVDRGSQAVVFGDRVVTLKDPESVRALTGAGAPFAQLSGRDYDSVRRQLVSEDAPKA